MLTLPDITLVAVVTRAHDLARVAINDCVSKVSFGGVLIYTNEPGRVAVSNAEYATVSDWPTKREAGNFYYTDAAKPIKTSRALLMEWDAGIGDVAAWSDEFLEYDYIGAPWPWLRNGDPLNVGNGGFALYSKRLIDFVYANRVRFPMWTDMDISRTHRPAIERETGFKWAPAEVAERFSFEGWNGRGGANKPTQPSFGYHGVFNWPVFLTRDELLTRALLLKANPFLVRTGKLKALCEHAPEWLSAELGYPALDLSSQVRSRAMLQRQRAIMARAPGEKA
jgi:hypothetical protein